MTATTFYASITPPLMAILNSVTQSHVASLPLANQVKHRSIWMPSFLHQASPLALSFGPPRLVFPQCISEEEYCECYQKEKFGVPSPLNHWIAANLAAMREFTNADHTSDNVQCIL